MTKNVTYKILPELRLVIENYCGTFNVNDYIELKKAQLNDPRFDPFYNNIADIRNSELSISNEDIKMCIDFMKTAEGLAGKRRAAVLTATPVQVVISTLFARYGNELPMEYEIVSTLGAAIEWVKMTPLNYDKIEGVLKELNGNVEIM